MCPPRSILLMEDMQVGSHCLSHNMLISRHRDCCSTSREADIQPLGDEKRTQRMDVSTKASNVTLSGLCGCFSFYRESGLTCDMFVFESELHRWRRRIRGSHTICHHVNAFSNRRCVVSANRLSMQSSNHVDRLDPALKRPGACPVLLSRARLTSRTVQGGWTYGSSSRTPPRRRYGDLVRAEYSR